MPLHTDVSYQPLDLSAATAVVLLGRRERLAASPIPREMGVTSQDWEAMLAALDPGDWGASGSTWAGGRKLVAAVLPESCSRHNSPSRAWAIPGLVRDAAGRGDAAVVALVDEPDHAFAAALAVARAFPLFARSGSSSQRRRLQVSAVGPAGFVEDAAISPGIDGVRLAARLYDTPTDALHTDALTDEARAVAQAVGAEIETIRGEDLRERGFGGLWGVGKAAERPPALVILRYKPENAARSVAWVGKGIVYDTGGLCLKPRDGMVGMKGDMGGAAAVLGAFQAAARAGVGYAITAVLCLAENAIGPAATRPDDILTLKSGKTVEINNTDAEGRLVLADGLAWAAAESGADLLIDLATLTGAQSISTGKVHAAIYCNDETVEAAALAAGRAAGEPCHALPYAPELFRREFRSVVADMKNSVKDRANAQSACAAQFIAAHLPDPAPRWLHIDIAGPSGDGENRGTGYGVGLLLALGAGPA